MLEVTLPCSTAVEQHVTISAEQQTSPSFPYSPHQYPGDHTIELNDSSSSCSSSAEGESDDEDEGVFFGKHSEAESRFLAKVSNVSPVASPSPPSRGSRRQSRLVSRIRRDSTEFHRRNTMLFTQPAIDDDEDDDQQGEDSMQERYQREISVLRISPSVLASTHKEPPVSPSRTLCGFLDHLHVSTSPSHDDSKDSDTSSNLDCSTDTMETTNTDSDKENSHIPNRESLVISSEEEVGQRGTTGSTAHSGNLSTEFSFSRATREDFAEGA